MALLMAVLMFTMPFVTFAQQNSVQAEAVAAAERDARNNTNIPLWFLGGFCCGVGVLIALDYEPALPAGQLLGKSPEYVAFYAVAYQAKAKSLRGSSASLGCAVGCIVYGLLSYVMGTAD